MRLNLAAALTTLALLSGLAACSPTSSGNGDRLAVSQAPSTTEPGAGIVITENTIILDVRTPEEFAGGHLDGAQLLDFNGGAFAAAVPTLDATAEYVLYCRSGSRAGQAIELLEQAGFTNVANLGSLEEAASVTGLPILD